MEVSDAAMLASISAAFIVLKNVRGGIPVINVG